MLILTSTVPFDSIVLHSDNIKIKCNDNKPALQSLPANRGVSEHRKFPPARSHPVAGFAALLKKWEE